MVWKKTFNSRNHILLHGMCSGYVCICYQCMTSFLSFCFFLHHYIESQSHSLQWRWCSLRNHDKEIRWTGTETDLSCECIMHWVYQALTVNLSVPSTYCQPKMSFQQLTSGLSGLLGWLHYWCRLHQALEKIPLWEIIAVAKCRATIQCKIHKCPPTIQSLLLWRS